MIPAAMSFCRRSARMFVAIFASDSRNCLNVRKARTIMSRMTSSDQRSPSASSEMLTGHPERWRGLGLLCTVQKLSDIACILQAIFCPTWVHGQGRTLASLEWRCEGKQNARPGICQDGRSLLKETYRLLLLADVVDESDRDPFGILRRAVRAHA